MNRVMLILVLSFATAGSLCAEDDTPYDRTLDKSLDKAHMELLRSSPDIFEDHSTWETAWKVKTGSFMVQTTHSRYLAVKLGSRLESISQEFASILKPDYKPSSIHWVYVFENLAQYNQFGDDNGETHSSIYGSFHAGNHSASPVAALYDKNETLLLMYVTHSALHQFVHKEFPQVQLPTWISEGLACYFSYRWGYSYLWGVDELKKMIDNNQFIPLSNLLGAPLEQYGQDTQARFHELGMLFYYLLQFREDTKITDDKDGDFVTYLRAILNRKPFTHLPAHKLFTENLSQLEADFKAFTFPRE